MFSSVIYLIQLHYRSRVKTIFGLKLLSISFWKIPEKQKLTNSSSNLPTTLVYRFGCHRAIFLVEFKREKCQESCNQVL